MGVVVQGDALRPQRDQLLQRVGQAGFALPGQAVDQIRVDGVEIEGPCVLEHLADHRHRLYPVHRLLHPGIEILHPQAQAVEAQPAQQTQPRAVDRAWIDFDGVVAPVVFEKMKIARQLVHQLGDLRVAQKRRRAAAPVHLDHRSLPVDKRRLLPDLGFQMGDVGQGAITVGGDHPVTGAVVANRRAERDMAIQGQIAVGAIARRHGTLNVAKAHFFMEPGGRRVGGVAGAGAAVLANQVRVPDGHGGCSKRRPGYRLSLAVRQY